MHSAIRISNLAAVMRMKEDLGFLSRAALDRKVLSAVEAACAVEHIESYYTVAIR